MSSLHVPVLRFGNTARIRLDSCVRLNSAVNHSITSRSCRKSTNTLYPRSFGSTTRVSAGKIEHTKAKNATTISSKSTPKKPVKYIIPKALAIGSFAGLCGSLAGMGGGFVMIPLMTSRILRLSQHKAHGTSLFAVTTTGIAGALGYSGQVDYQAAGAIAFSGMITARFGARATSALSEVALKRALGIFMLGVAPLVPAKTYLAPRTKGGRDEEPQGTSDNNPNDVETKPWNSGRLIVPAMIGSCSGFLAGLFGVGGGAIVVPALTLTTNMNHYQALGTSLCAMSLPALVGTITHYGKGNVAMRVAPGLAVGAFVGGYVGGRLGLNIDESKLKWAFSGLMVLLGGRTLLKT